jgi:hypothetical protein
MGLDLVNRPGNPDSAGLTPAADQDLSLDDYRQADILGCVTRLGRGCGDDPAQDGN